MPQLLLCLSLILTLPAQTPAPPKGPDRDAILQASRTIIAGAHYATLVTVDGASQPDARIVDPFAPESDFTIWLATKAASRKVTELRKDPRVTLLYFDAATKGYVTVKGTARLVNDPAMKAKYWKNEWNGMYANKNQGDDYLLVQVTPDTLEVVSVALGMMNDSVTWKPVTITIK